MDYLSAKKAAMDGARILRRPRGKHWDDPIAREALLNKRRRTLEVQARARFEGGYTPEPNSGCWLWEGPYNDDGYGIIHYQGRRWRAHRLSLHLAGTMVPRGTSVCHHCDNPACVNPSHLYVGTQQDNVKDREQRGRSAIGARNGMAVLTEDQVRQIRASQKPYREIAAEYGIARVTVKFIRWRRTWKHVA